METCSTSRDAFFCNFFQEHHSFDCCFEVARLAVTACLMALKFAGQCTSRWMARRLSRTISHMENVPKLTASAFVSMDQMKRAFKTFNQLCQQWNLQLT